MRLWGLFGLNSLGVEGPPGIPFKMTRKKVELFCARLVPCGRRAILKPENDRFVNFQPRSCLHKEASKFNFFEFFGLQFPAKIELPKRVLGQQFHCQRLGHWNFGTSKLLMMQRMAQAQTPTSDNHTCGNVRNVYLQIM